MQAIALVFGLSDMEFYIILSLYQIASYYKFLIDNIV